MLVAVVGVCVFLALLGVYGRCMWRRWRRWCRFVKMGEQFKGPKRVPIIGNIHEIPKSSFEWVRFLINQANECTAQGEHAMRLWVGNNLFVFPLDGKTLRDVVDSTVELSKGRDYDLLVPWLGTGLLISTGEKWRQRRRMLTPMFHFSMLESYNEIFDSEAQILLRQIEKFANREVFDVFPFIKRCALDIICVAAMGVKVNAQEHHNHPYVLAVREMNELLFIKGMQPWYNFTPLWYAAGYGFKQDQALKVLTEFTKGVIRKRSAAVEERTRRKAEGKRLTFLDMLLDFKGENKLSDEDVREEVDTFMFAGHDTTSSSMSWTLWCLAGHPDVQDKVAAELYSVFGDSNRSITTEDLKNLPYLEMCIKEAMRLFSPVPMVQRAIVHEDLLIGDQVIPKGGVAMIAQVLIHHNNTIYPNCDSFNPDNFLPEMVANRHPYDFVPFSAGMRNCIGQRFAMNEMKTVIAWILRRYRIHLGVPFEENRPGPEIVMIPEKGFPLLIQTRSFHPHQIQTVI